jgi:hypothetical protein
MAVKRRNSPIQIYKPQQALVRNTSGIKITAIRFPRGYVEVKLNDGTIVKRPITHYPGIKNLTIAQRKKVHVSGGEAVDFDDAPEVYHISDFIGGTISEYE